MLLCCPFLLLSLICLALVNTESFLFPADTPVPFIEGDLVNVTWNVVTPRLSLFEVCGYNVSCLESEFLCLQDRIPLGTEYFWIRDGDTTYLSPSYSSRANSIS
jgi:hypothetical protein